MNDGVADLANVITPGGEEAFHAYPAGGNPAKTLLADPYETVGAALSE